MSIFKQPELFFQNLRTALAQPLPGEAAQNRMSARSRISTQSWLDQRPDHKKSAVLLPLFPHQGEIYTSLILRPTYEGVHSGQLALPGGKQEPFDASLEATALRETNEEVGIVVSPTQLIGQLSPIYIPVSNFLVQPFIAQFSERPEYVRSPDEVEAILDIPLTHFLDESVKTEQRIAVGKNMFLDAPGYLVEERLLWGATAMMFGELEVILKQL